MARILVRKILGGGVVGLLAREEVRVRRGEAEAATLPAHLVLALPLLGGYRQRGLAVDGDDEADARLASLAAELRVVGLHPALVVRVQRCVPRGHAEVRRALEHHQGGGLAGDDRDRLDRGGAGADDADALAGEVHLRVRPVAGVIGRAREALQTREGRDPGGRQTSGRHDAEAGRHAVAAIRLDLPPVRRLVEARRGHPRLELNVAPEIEAVGDVLDVPQDLGLGGVPLRPVPFLLELVGEGIGVVHALDIAAGAGVAVPVPGAADAAARFVDPRGQAEAAQAVQHVQAGEPGADDDGVEVAALSWAARGRLWLVVQLGPRLPSPPSGTGQATSASHVRLAQRRGTEGRRVPGDSGQAT